MWLYEVFKESMDARIQAQGIIMVLYVIFTVVYYEIVIDLVAAKKPVLLRLQHIKNLLLKDRNEEDILRHIEESNTLLASFGTNVDSLYNSF